MRQGFLHHILLWSICGFLPVLTQSSLSPHSILTHSILTQSSLSLHSVLTYNVLIRWTRRAMQVDASLQNQNLRTHLRWAAKLIRKSARKFTQMGKIVNFTQTQLTCDRRMSTCVGWPNGKNLASGRPNEMQVEACRRIASNCEQ